MTDFATLVLNADSRGLVSGEQALDRFADTAERTENRTGKALDNVGRSARELGKQSTFSSQALRMQAMQLSQVAQQATATGNVMQAIAIQLPDLALVFGPIGIAAGAAAGAVLSYFSSFDGAEDSNVVLEEQIRLIKEVADNWGDAIPALREYADELERAKSLADLQTGGRLTVEAQYDKIREELEGFNEEYGRTLELLNSTDGTDEAVMRLSVAYEDLQEKIRNGTATVEDFHRVQQAATEVAATKGFEDIAGFASAFDGLTGKVMQSLGAIQQLQAALNGQARMLNPRTWRSAGMSGQDADGPIQGNGFILPDIGPVPGSRGTPELSGFPWEDFNKRSRGGGRSKKSDSDYYDDIVKSAERRIQTLEAERDAIGLTEQAADKLRYQTDLLNDAQEKGIKLSPEQRANLETLAETMARVEHETRVAQEQMDFFNDISDDLKDGFLDAIVEGEKLDDVFKDLAKSIAKAALEAALFGTGPFASGGGKGGGGGGFLTAIFGGLGKLFSFDGGGSTGPGSRSGGLDGKGGFMAMLHPNETVIDHTKSGNTAGGVEVSIVSRFLADGSFESVVEGISQKQVGRAAPGIVSAANQQVVPTMAKYQNNKAGADWR
ncbi:hypothetical protein N5K21_26680 [Rhizobium pusense]|uniref:hypothetical protein n=1 Tax=Agrobacterium pusense TaxID=648995 RepID=UPI00244D5D4B|nr:hypothetical protein [Agrobacterium pusense]MDH2092309.1 hypothetical protein [Agrobacterium pusense]